MTLNRHFGIKALTELANELDCTMAQFALAWCLSNQDVSTVITGASKPEQINQNMKALELVKHFDAGLLEKVEAILANKPSGMPDARDG